METTQTMTTSTTPRRTRSAAAQGPALDLDALSRMDVAALGELYTRGSHPAQVDALEGNPRGRMLAVRTLDRGVAAGAIRSVAGASFFPWGGKTFAGRGTNGTGVNRLHLLGRHQLFPFHTRIAASAIDGAPCIALDYDLPDNPGVIRKIHDEVREVSPGLFLGPAMWKAAKGPTLVLWFALDTRVQSKPVGHARDLA
ncbi:MAG TPA: hypothetical protein VMI75_11275 [Polyangiaceae bacterium]|nr:hypothetical protein [Polyangiaceae bacterium]